MAKVANHCQANVARWSAEIGAVLAEVLPTLAGRIRTVHATNPALAQRCYNPYVKVMLEGKILGDSDARRNVAQGVTTKLAAFVAEENGREIRGINRRARACIPRLYQRAM